MKQPDAKKFMQAAIDELTLDEVTTHHKNEHQKLAPIIYLPLEQKY